MTSKKCKVLSLGFFLLGFKPDVYREMQETRGYHEMALNFTK